MSEQLDKRYLYTVYPRKAIRNLNENISIIRVPKSLMLTKEEVFKCLECGTVYRRFSNIGKVEKTNKYDVDRVHRANYYSQAEWKIICDKKNDSPIIEPTNGDPAVITNNNLGRGETKPELYITDEPTLEKNKEEVFTSGYVTDTDAPAVNIDSQVTIASSDEYVEVKYKDLVSTENEVSDEKEEESPDDVDDVSESEDIDESETEDDVEDEISEELEEVSTDSTTPVTKTVVNYGKKKKHHH